MTIRAANYADLPGLQQLLATASTSFQNAGIEDLAAMVGGRGVVLGEDGRGMWGMAAFEHPVQATSSPACAPLRFLALRKDRTPADHGVALLQAGLASLDVREQPVEALAFCSRSWLHDPLRRAGFTETERIQFLELPNLQRRAIPPAAPDAQIRLLEIEPSELAVLGALDAAAFPVRWQLTDRALSILLLAGQTRGAWRGNRLIGYAALSVRADGTALLDRLAVAPDEQRQGIGRRLLLDALARARAAAAETILLNTQSNNEPSQSLYRSVGFRSTGITVPILTRLLGNRSTRL